MDRSNLCKRSRCENYKARTVYTVFIYRWTQPVSSSKVYLKTDTRCPISTTNGIYAINKLRRKTNQNTYKSTEQILFYMVQKCGKEKKYSGEMDFWRRLARNSRRDIQNGIGFYIIGARP